MQAVANNPAFAKKVGVPQSVGREFTKAKGGVMAKESKKMMKKEVAFMKKKGAPKSMIKHEEAEAKGKKMAGGGRMGAAMADRMGRALAAAPAMRAARAARMARMAPAVMKKGGAAKKMAGGGLAAGHKSADGIAKKGKTKTKMPAMRYGGKC